MGGVAENENSFPGAVVLLGGGRHVSVTRHVELSQSRLILSTACPLLSSKPDVIEHTPECSTVCVYYGKQAV